MEPLDSPGVRVRPALEGEVVEMGVRVRREPPTGKLDAP
jgi:hypothetical protein